MGRKCWKKHLGGKKYKNKLEYHMNLKLRSLYKSITSSKISERTQYGY